MATFTGMFMRDSGRGGKVLSVTCFGGSLVFTDVDCFGPLHEKRIQMKAGSRIRVRFGILGKCRIKNAKCKIGDPEFYILHF
jgi:hypothetical protein